MPEFYTMSTRKIFSPIFFGGEANSPLPPSPMLMVTLYKCFTLLCLCMYRRGQIIRINRVRVGVGVGIRVRVSPCINPGLALTLNLTLTVAPSPSPSPSPGRCAIIWSLTTECCGVASAYWSEKSGHVSVKW